MSLSFGLKVRTVVKPSHVVRDLGDLLSDLVVMLVRHGGEIPSLHSPPRRLLPIQCRQAQLGRQAQLEQGLSIRYGSSWMTPKQHTLKLSALPKLTALPTRSYRLAGAASARATVSGVRSAPRSVSPQLTAPVTASVRPQPTALRNPSTDHKLRLFCYGMRKVPRLPLQGWYRR